MDTTVSLSPSDGERVRVRGCGWSGDAKQNLPSVALESQTPPMPSQIARLLRKQQTPAEKLLWRWLRGRRFSGFKFRRQHPMGNYVLDFYCCEARFNIELDGGGHNDRAQELQDKRRDAFLKAQGILVLRFSNSSLLENADGVRTMMWEALHDRTSAQQQRSR